MAGLVLAQAYQQAFEDVSICFIGTVDGFEAKLVSSYGHRLETVQAAPIAKEGLTGRMRAVWCMGVGTLSARRILRKRGVRLVIGMGSYASAAGVMAGKMLGLRTAVHEANDEPGLANRMLGRWVDRVYVASSAAAGSFSARSSVLVTGNPVRSEIAAIAEARLPPTGDRPAKLLVLGGSLGSPFLNEQVPHIAVRLIHRGTQLQVVHQTGHGSAEPVRRLYTQLGIDAHVAHYIDDMAAAYRDADFAIACAGALTLSELAASALPCLLVPLGEAADDHQSVNARAFADATGATWVRENQWQADQVTDQIAATLSNIDVWLEQSKRSLQLAHADAAGRIIEDCEQLMKGRW